MQVVHGRLGKEPHITLIARSAPEPIGSFPPPVEDRLILPLIIGTPQGEMMFRPNQERRIMSAGPRERAVQAMQLGGGHKHVDRTRRRGQNVAAYLEQKTLEFATKIIILNGAARALPAG